MAYVPPRSQTQDITAAVIRQGRRFVAIASYAAAVAVALALLAPILPRPGSKATAVAPSGLKPIVYTVKAGDSMAVVAASHGISLAELFALNPDVTPLPDAAGDSIVVGLG